MWYLKLFSFVSNFFTLTISVWPLSTLVKLFYLCLVDYGVWLGGSHETRSRPIIMQAIKYMLSNYREGKITVVINHEYKAEQYWNFSYLNHGDIM